MVWPIIAAFVAALVVAFNAMPKPQTRPPAAFGDIQVPTAEVGRCIPVLFGTMDMESPNVTWYGDFEARAVRRRGGKK